MGLKALTVDTTTKRFCKVGRVILDLPEPYQSAAINLVNTQYLDGGLSDRGLSAKFASAGIHLSATSLNSHRNRLCACTRKDN